MYRWERQGEREEPRSGSELTTDKRTLRATALGVLSFSVMAGAVMSCAVGARSAPIERDQVPTGGACLGLTGALRWV